MKKLWNILKYLLTNTIGVKQIIDLLGQIFDTLKDGFDLIKKFFDMLREFKPKTENDK